jgi:small redox-active disulfide protein 2
VQIQVLGSGCASCRVLEARTIEAVRQLGLDVTVEKVGDQALLAEYEICSVPALVVDGEVLFCGVLPDIPELKWVLSRIAAAPV